MKGYSLDENDESNVLDRWISFSGNDEKLIIYAIADLVGQHSQVRIEIFDNNGIKLILEFKVEITNQSPLILKDIDVSIPTKAIIGQKTMIYIPGTYFKEPDGDTLIYSSWLINEEEED